MKRVERVRIMAQQKAKIRETWRDNKRVYIVSLNGHSVMCWSRPAARVAKAELDKGESK